MAANTEAMIESASLTADISGIFRENNDKLSTPKAVAKAALMIHARMLELHPDISPVQD